MCEKRKLDIRHYLAPVKTEDRKLLTAVSVVVVVLLLRAALQEKLERWEIAV